MATPDRRPSIAEPIQIESPPDVPLHDDEDEIVQTIPLFHASGPGNSLSLLQFPLVSRAGTVDIQMVSKDMQGDGYTFTFSPPLDLMGGSDDKRLMHTKKVDLSQPIALGVLRDGQLHLTPIHEVLQGRPEVQAEAKVEGTAVGWVDLRSNDQFIAASSDDIASRMSVSLFQGRLADTRTGLNPQMIENLSDEAIKSRSPREQLYLMLMKEKTVYYDDVLKQLGLKAYANELQDVLLQYAYFVQGRWTVKPEELPETVLSVELRLARAFVIVLFAHEKKMSTNEMLPKFMSIFGLQKSHLQMVLQKLGVKVDNGKLISFGWKHNTTFENTYPDTVAKAQEAILKLKENVCLAMHDDHLFDEFLR